MKNAREALRTLHSARGGAAIDKAAIPGAMPALRKSAAFSRDPAMIVAFYQGGEPNGMDEKQFRRFLCDFTLRLIRSPRQETTG